MRYNVRAAALTAAALSFFAAGALSGPSIAARADSAPAASFAEHDAAALTAASLGLNDLQDEAAQEGAASGQESDIPAPVATHAVATAVPETGLGEEPDDNIRRSLVQLVGDYSASDTPDSETDCLARAVYWESKGEPYSGQLAVAEVIINRAHSGRFASTVCGVVRQAGQFSFVRRGAIPQAPQGSRDWHVAVAIAQIAMQNLANGAAPRALFFHARRVNPGWHLTRVATVGNHVFYR